MEERARCLAADTNMEGFNGATAMKPWKSLSPSVKACSCLWLQWGHGDEAVEELRDGWAWVRNPIMLQWGHGDEAVEEPWAKLTVREIWEGFNGATAMKPWKSSPTS